MDIFKKKTVIITAAAVCSFGIHMYAYAADEPSSYEISGDSPVIRPKFKGNYLIEVK